MPPSLTHLPLLPSLTHLPLLLSLTRLSLSLGHPRPLSPPPCFSPWVARSPSCPLARSDRPFDHALHLRARPTRPSTTTSWQPSSRRPRVATERRGSRRRGLSRGHSNESSSWWSSSALNVTSDPRVLSFHPRHRRFLP